MVSYESIKETFESKGCQLITTKYEMTINKMNSKSKYKIIATCGHLIDNCDYHMFKSKLRDRQKLCKECVNKKLSFTYKKLNENRSEKYTLQIESQSIQLLKKYINNSLSIQVSPECCTADVAIKDITCKDNKWLPIQVKSTLKVSTDNSYIFALKHSYNILIIFICIEEEKFWVIPGSSILNSICLSIGLAKSKYNKYQVDKLNLSEKLIQYYKLSDTHTIENVQKPITENCQKEQIFRKLRETKLYTIVFEYPGVNQCVYDFKINNYKIQEKTARTRIDCNLIVLLLQKTKNSVGGNPYELGDNDFYWVNLPDKETFYIIPETDLFNNGFIGCENQNARTDLSFAKRNTWLNSFKFYYNEENINEIINNYLKN